jgi:putative membrane protein
MGMIPFLKALHVVGFVSWFAGLFYLVRIFVYHAEAFRQPEEERRILVRQYRLMEGRVYRIIAQPAMYITWIAGLLMLVVDYAGIDRRAYFIGGTPGWLYVKLVLLLGLTLYHWYCGKLQRVGASGDKLPSSFQLRLLNEVPTLFLVSISFVAVFGKAGTLHYGYLAAGMMLFAALVGGGAWAYKKYRRDKA